MLDPVDRISEVLFGLFMVLTFTGSLSVASAGRDDVRTMMIAAIGCNVAWGFVDAVMYVLRTLVARGHHAAFTQAVRAADPARAQRLIADELAPDAGPMDPAVLETVRQWMVSRPHVAARRLHPTPQDLRAALGVFCLVVASTFPPVLPFVLLPDLRLAMRVSAGIAIAMLFVCGWGWGRYAGLHPAKVGAVMVLLGGLIQSAIIALGG